MSIRITIERIILEGIDLPLSQRRLFQASLEGELTRLLSSGDSHSGLTAGGARPYLHGGTIQMSRENTPLQLGQHVARAVYQGIGKL